MYITRVLTTAAKHSAYSVEYFLRDKQYSEHVEAYVTYIPRVADFRTFEDGRLSLPF